MARDPRPVGCIEWTLPAKPDRVIGGPRVPPGAGPLDSLDCRNAADRWPSGGLRLRELHVPTAGFGCSGLRAVVTIRNHPNLRRTNGKTRSNHAARRPE